MHSTIPSATLAAYTGANYRVDADPPFVMRVGERCAALAALGASSCAFITACNPMGEAYSDAANTQLQQAFSSLLAQRGLAWLTGAGCDPLGQWPCEPSFLVPGLALDDARALGIALRQNAIVWCGADLVPRLILLR